MNKMCALLVVSLTAMIAWCDLFVRFRITDTDHNPLTNAVVRARALLVGHPNAGMYHSDYRYCRSGTDAFGYADVVMRTADTRMEWGVSAGGFYDTCWNELVCHDKDLEGRIAGRTKDAPKIVNVLLHPKRNPIPAYAFYSYMRIRTPRTCGEFGFDLKIGDWLSPKGKGEIADFYLVRKKIVLDGKTGVFEFFRFDDGCGFHRYRKTGYKEFPTTYAASTNEFYESELRYMTLKEEEGRAVGILYTNPVSKDEFLVLRTRVKKDACGNVVSANYSKILGEVKVEDYFQIKEAVFNPTPNDTNLEFDPARNLNRHYMSCGLTP